MQVFCTLPVAGPAESIKNKMELWPFFASFLFAFNVEKRCNLLKSRSISAVLVHGMPIL